MTIPDALTPYLPPSLEGELRHGAFLFPVVPEKWQMICTTLAHQSKLPLLTLTASDERTERGGFIIYAVFGVPKTDFAIVPYLELKQTEFPSLVSYLHEV